MIAGATIHTSSPIGTVTEAQMARILIKPDETLGRPRTLTGRFSDFSPSGENPVNDEPRCLG